MRICCLLDNDRQIVLISENIFNKELIMVTVIKKGTNKKDLEKALANLSTPKKLNARKYQGVIKLDEDPLQVQKRLRNEW